MSARCSGVMAVVVLFSSACFHPNYDRPTCGSNGECPSGLICSSQGLCERLPDTCRSFGLDCPPGQICAASQPVCVDIGGCGDGIVEAGEPGEPREVCDDGNIIDGDGCSSDCRSNEICGNDIIDIGEECDGGGSCAPDCHLLFCGNTIRDPGEDCDEGRETQGCDADCTFSICGDGHTNVTIEQCDSGNFDTPACNGSTADSASCRFASCGDGHINLAAGENCETPDGMDSAACNGASAGPAACQPPACGDGYFNPHAEDCEPGVNESCDNLQVCDNCRCGNDV